MCRRQIETEIEKMKEEMTKMRLMDGNKPGMTRVSSVYTRKDSNKKEVE